MEISGLLGTIKSIESFEIPDEMKKSNLIIITLFIASCSQAHDDKLSPGPANPEQATAQQAVTYYIDAQTGNDNNNGTSDKTPWQSLVRANQLTLKAGDRLLFKRGSTFHGVLEICGHGQSGKPIEVGAYGKGERPKIVGYDESDYAVRILNSEYLTLRDLEIVNTGKERKARRTGLMVACSDYGLSRCITIDGLFIHDVNGSLVKEEGGGSALFIVNRGKTIASRFDSLTISNCHIKDCARNAMIWSGYYNRHDWLPNTHVVVRGNLIEGVPGDGIVPIGCDGTLIEYNVMRNCPDMLPMTEAAAGIWPWSCDNTIIQFNEVSDHKAPWDAQGYDCDYNCRNTLIQYNYSHDNYGGMVLICDSGNERNYSIGNQGSRVRYNISIGDGMRSKETRQGMFSPNIHIAGRVEDTQVDHNIIHSNPKTVGNADRTMVCSDSWDGYADNTSFTANIFYTAETSRFEMTSSTNNLFSGNWYLGNYSSLPGDKAGRTVSHYYQQQVIDKDAKGYAGLLQLMDRKNICGQDCHFVNKEKIERFFSLMD